MGTCCVFVSCCCTIYLIHPGELVTPGKLSEAAATWSVRHDTIVVPETMSPAQVRALAEAKAQAQVGDDDMVAFLHLHGSRPVGGEISQRVFRLGRQDCRGRHRLGADAALSVAGPGRGGCQGDVLHGEATSDRVDGGSHGFQHSCELVRR